MDSQKLKIILIITLGAFLALYLGVAAATAQDEAIAWVCGVATLVGLLYLGRHVWVLIPLGLCLSGNLNCIPGAPLAWYIATPLAAIFLLLRFATRAPNFLWRWTWLDTLVLLNVLMLVQAYMRNPTGLHILGGVGGNIGGKTYFDYLIVTSGFYILSTVKTEWKIVRRVLYIMVGIQVCDGLLGAATSFSSGLAAVVSHVYSNVDYDSAISGLTDGMGVGTGYNIDTRFTNLPLCGLSLGLICCTFWRPITSLNLVRPYRPLILMLALAALMMSGFRSQLMRFFLFFIAGTAARRKPLDLVMAAAMGVVLICIVLVGGFAQNLPFAAQRSLSFLPIGVSEGAKHQGEQSSDWRFDMWRLALTTDRYIHNKLLGDGFGFSAAELRVNLDPTKIQTAQQQQDFFMSKGSYHGFHVECIRFVGAIGLLICTCILFVCSAKAWQLIRYFEGRPGWTAVLFLCVPYLIEPIQYWWLFGSYKGNFMPYLLGVGLLKLLDNIRVAELADARALAVQATEPKDAWVALRQQPVRGG